MAVIKEKTPFSVKRRKKTNNYDFKLFLEIIEENWIDFVVNN